MPTQEGTSVIKLPSPLQEKVNKGIIEAARKWNVNLSGQTTFYFDRKGHFYGNKKLADGSKHTYVYHYSALWTFLAMIEDYESMLMLVTPKLANVPAMNVESLTAYIRYKKMKKGTILSATDDSPPIIVGGRDLTCVGTWNAKKPMKQFTAAISRVHKAHNHTGQYHDVCENCQTAMKNDSHCHGCPIHIGRLPRVFRHGNVTKDQVYDEVKSALIDGSYKEHGCDSLDPKDVRELRKSLLFGRNCRKRSLAHLGAYVIILISIRLFLRSDEILPLKVEDFYPDCFVRTGPDDEVHGLCLRVWGKVDKEWKHYWLWVDNEYPELCPVRHLLIYLHFAKIRDGYVFPPWEELLEPESSDTSPSPKKRRRRQCASRRTHRSGRSNPEDSIHISYSTFSKWFKQTVKDVLPNGAVHLVIGLHMLRKTGYKFAIWGHGAWEVIKRDARHLNDEDAQKYAGDSWSTMKIENIFNDELNKVKKYEPSYCKNPRQGAISNQNSTAAGIELSRLVAEYVASLSVAPVLQSDIGTLIAASINHKNKKTSNQLIAELGEELTPQQKAKLDQALNRLMQENAARAARLSQEAAKRSATESTASGVGGRSDSNQESDQNADDTSGTQGELTPVVAAKKRATEIVEWFPGRDGVANIESVVDKVKFLSSLWEKGPAKPSEIKNNAEKTFYKRTLKPVMTCLQNHFNNDIEVFASHWQQAFKMHFGQNCCNGNPSTPCR